jgi:hypothetical protein
LRQTVQVTQEMAALLPADLDFRNEERNQYSRMTGVQRKAIRPRRGQPPGSSPSRP